MLSKEVVIAATTKLFIDREESAIDEFFGPTYIQHSALASDGLEGLRALVSSIPEGFRYEPVRAFSEGNLVVTHGIYHGFGEQSLVSFDVWRVDNGRIVEHWDALAPVVPNTLSGRTQTDGPTIVSEHERTDTNRAIVQEFAERVLVGADYSAVARYISTDNYAQHNPEAADGLQGFGVASQAWAEAGKRLDYKKVHQIIAEGDFVFLRSEGEFGEPVIYNDLFRLHDGKIVEHWDVIAPLPAPRTVHHGNGVF
ncbi:nuclear transport factor 2 family protein [Lysinibacter sp. HNR]|uniref:nuclear transport factor 2 family protein n=1 Tax=Lysinibacter sp. HNR TaxID=3031408 RepID=UPI002434F3D9|nr:nuclear transport factor 2 family protein [Lysinibacter sp. HNR]WGD37778.1 nuclear transport factor 2 family protein [Lysinibacter sp. HNR]